SVGATQPGLKELRPEFGADPDRPGSLAAGVASELLPPRTCRGEAKEMWDDRGALADRGVARAPERRDPDRGDCQIRRMLVGEVEIRRVERLPLLEVLTHGHEHAGPHEVTAGLISAVVVVEDPIIRGRQRPDGRLVVVGSEGQLLEVVGALGASGGL